MGGGKKKPGGGARERREKTKQRRVQYEASTRGRSHGKKKESLLQVLGESQQDSKTKMSGTRKMGTLGKGFWKTTPGADRWMEVAEGGREEEKF